MPSKVDRVEFKTKDTVLVGFDNGLELSFRIHNDSEIIGKTNPKLEWKITKYPSQYYSKEIADD